MAFPKKAKNTTEIQLYFIIAGRLCTAGVVTAVGKEYIKLFGTPKSETIYDLGFPDKENGRPFIMTPRFYICDERKLRADAYQRGDFEAVERCYRKPAFNISVRGRLFDSVEDDVGHSLFDNFSHFYFADGQRMSVASFCAEVDSRKLPKDASPWSAEWPNVNNRIAFGSTTPSRDRLIRQELRLKAAQIATAEAA